MKHTPGTWKSEVWDYTVGPPPRKELVITTGKYRIALLECDFPGDNPYLIPQEEAMANARLIAAAPEMVKALQIAYDCLRRPEAERDENRVTNIINELLARIEG